PELYEAVNIRAEQLAIVANIKHPLAEAKSLQPSDLANCRWAVYSANMPMRLLLAREAQGAGLLQPLNLFETTSACMQLSVLQRNPSMVALLSIDAARFGTRFGMTRILPLRLHSRSEPYYLITRRDRTLSPNAALFVREMLADDAAWRGHGMIPSVDSRNV